MARHLKQPAQTYAAHTYPLPAQQPVPQSYADHQAYRQQAYAAQNTYQPQAYTAQRAYQQHAYQQQPKDRPSKHPRNHRWRAAAFVLLCLVICAA